MLLAGHAQRHHTGAQGRIQFGETAADRVDPPLRFLLAAAIIPRHQFQRVAVRGQHLVRHGIVRNELHALGAYIKSNDQAHCGSRGLGC